jgi:hypothetical protein
MELETLLGFQVGPGGWVLVRGRDYPAPVYVRFQRGASGRLEVAELYIDGNGRIDPAFLRWLPLVTLEALANEPDTSEHIASRLGEPGVDLRRLAAHFAHTWAATRSDRRIDHWVARSYFAQLPGSGEPQAPMPRRRPWQPARVEAPPLTLKVPTTASYPDSFYLAVADAYSYLALISPRPSVELADRNRVPVTTTRRWVKEARRRGLLAPGQKGRRG